MPIQPFFLALAVLVSSLLMLSGPAAAGDLETEVARMARIGSTWSPAFSPDGQWIAFVSDLTGVPQVWKMETAGGFPILLTPLEDQVGEVTWSPSGEWLAFTLAPGGGMNQQIYLMRPDGTGLHRVTEGGRDNNWLGDWSPAGGALTFASNRRRPEAMDAFLYDLGEEKVQLIAENPGIGSVTDLGRDGRRAVIYRMANRGDNDLFLLDRANGGEILLTPHEGPGTFGGGQLSRDGQTVYLTSNKNRDLTAFARVRLSETGEPGGIEILAERDDAEAAWFVLSDSGELAILVWNVAGRSELELLDLASGERSPLPALPGEILGGLDWSQDGRRLAAVVSGSTRPMDLWILESQGESWGSWRQLTHSPHPGVDLSSLVAPELVRYRAHDGLELSGWLYRPPGVSGPAPYVLSFHGGPESQEQPRFRSVYQALLMRGIGVFAPNVRGSAGFGKRFVNLDNGELRVDAVRDIRASAAYLLERGLAAPGRLGIMGGSYGGYMTMAGLAEYPDLFAAGANLFGVVNFETFFEQTEPWMAAVSASEYGDPKTQRELLRRLSPIHRVDRVKAPTLVLHGANDTNVPVVEAEQVVESLRRRQVPVEYVLFPDEGHGFRKAANRTTAATAIVRWFERYLAAAGDGATSTPTS